jgi:Trk-type K+ transport system membrane component
MKQGHFFDKPENVKKVLVLFYVSLLVLIIMELLIQKDPHFSWEGFPAFYATYGFVGCVGLVLGAKYILRNIVKRKEDYYD